MSDSPRYITADTIAADWSVSTRTALRWMHTGHFGPVSVIAGTVRVSAEGYRQGERAARTGRGMPSARPTRQTGPRPLERRRGRFKDGGTEAAG